MNNQIDKLSELAEKAGLHREWSIDNPEIEKFAELIINECIANLEATAEKEKNDWMGDEPPLNSYIRAIKKHFGVN